MFSPLEQFDIILFFPLFFFFISFYFGFFFLLLKSFFLSWFFLFTSMDICSEFLFNNGSFFILLPLDFSFTNLSFFYLYINLFFIFIIFLVFNKIWIIPNKAQHFLENFFLFFYRLVVQQVGNAGLVFLPFFFFIFNFIFLANFISMLPFSFAPTSHVFGIFFLSLSLCLGIFLTGFFINGFKIFKLFVPEVPLILYPLMLLIELASYCIKSLSLGIRLCANLISGHTLMHILFSVIKLLPSLLVNNFIIVKLLVFISVILLCFSIVVLELGVAFLQAYVYVLLLLMYLNDALHPDQH